MIRILHLLPHDADFETSRSSESLERSAGEGFTITRKKIGRGGTWRDVPTAAAMLRQRILLVPNTDFSRAVLAATLGHLGEIEEARRVWAALMQIHPKFSFSAYIGRQPMRPEDAERVVAGLAKTGLS